MHVAVWIFSYIYIFLLYFVQKGWDKGRECAKGRVSEEEEGEEEEEEEEEAAKEI